MHVIRSGALDRMVIFLRLRLDRLWPTRAERALTRYSQASDPASANPLSDLRAVCGCDS